MTSSRFVRACLGLPVDRTPVWFLRQAGRYMPEYMAVRAHHSLLDICRTPSIAAEVTITAAERLGVDAAIIFADLLLPLTPMGLDFDFIAGEGPQVRTPLRTPEQIAALRTDHTEDLLYVSRAIEKVAKHFKTKGTGIREQGTERQGTGRRDQGSESPSGPNPYSLIPDPSPLPEPWALNPDPSPLGIIGFIGAPFTLASYMIEGGSSRNYIETKRIMYASASPANPSSRPKSAPFADAVESGVPSERLLLDGVQRPPHFALDPATSPSSRPESQPHGATATTAWSTLMAKLVRVLTDYAAQQVAAGADVIQVFDSWAGALSVADYTDFCLGPTTELIANIRALGVPVIYFGVDTASLLPAMKSTGADVLGLDWRIPLAEARRTLGNTPVQGNLDPITLFASPELIERRTLDILAQNAGRPGHIFNLGHGIVPGTPVDHVLHVVDTIKRHATTPPRARHEAASDYAIRA